METFSWASFLPRVCSLVPRRERTCKCHCLTKVPDPKLLHFYENRLDEYTAFVQIATIDASQRAKNDNNGAAERTKDELFVLRVRFCFSVTLDINQDEATRAAVETCPI